MVILAACKYKIVRVEAPLGSIIDREITCISCGGLLNGREGTFVLKYFLVERPTPRATNIATQASRKVVKL